MGTKSALGNKRQLTNQMARKDASLFWKALSSLIKGTDGCVVWSEHLLSQKMDMLQNMVLKSLFEKSGI